MPPRSKHFPETAGGPYPGRRVPARNPRAAAGLGPDHRRTPPAGAPLVPPGGVPNRRPWRDRPFPRRTARAHARRRQYPLRTARRCSRPPWRHRGARSANSSGPAPPSPRRSVGPVSRPAPGIRKHGRDRFDPEPGGPRAGPRHLRTGASRWLRESRAATRQAEAPYCNSGLGRGLLHSPPPVPRHILQTLNDARRPVDLYDLRRRITPQAEVDRTGARRSIAETGTHMVILSGAPGDDLDPRSDRVAIALGAHQQQLQPVVSARAVVHPDLRRRSDGADHHIQPPVSVQIAHGRATVAPWRLRGQTRFGRERGKLRASQVAKHRVVLVDFDARRGCQRLHVPAGDKYVLPAIVIEIANGRRVARHGETQRGDSAAPGNLVKPLLSRVSEYGKGFIVQRHDGDIRVTVVIDIAKIGPHPGDGLPVLP